MAKVEHFCRLCRNTSENNEYHNISHESTREILKALSLKSNLNEKNKKDVVCGVCSKKLFAAFDFKSACLSIEEIITSYIEHEPTSQGINLKDVYQKELGPIELLNTSDELKICRLCLELINGKFTPFLELQVNIINNYIPEVNLNVTEDPVICELCYDSLTTYATFIKNCLNLEEKTKNYHVDNQPHIPLLDLTIETEDTEIKSEVTERESEKVLIQTEASVHCEENELKREFKIVETSGKGTKPLIVVPSAWEARGLLYWPRIGADNLVKMAASVPKDDWFVMQCKLKKSHLVDCAVAEQELEAMLDRDVTQQDKPVEVVEKCNRSRVSLTKPNRYKDGCNSLTTDYVDSEEFIRPPSVTKENLSFTNHNSSSQKSFAISNGPGTVPRNNETVFEYASSRIPTHDLLNDKLNNILANQEIIFKNQNAILENFQSVATKRHQTEVMQRLQRLESAIGVVIDNNIRPEVCSCSNASLPNKEEIPTNPVCLPAVEDMDVLRPIVTFEDLANLEEKLSDKNVMENYVQRLSHICGKRGNENGINSCYVLVDIIFSRKFMTLCSWAGGTRDKTEKIPFKIYRNTMKLFFKVAFLSDENFTLKDCEQFFKSVLRNARRRNESSMTRSSKMKRRPKNLSYRLQGNSHIGGKTGDDADAAEKDAEMEDFGESSEDFAC